MKKGFFPFKKVNHKTKKQIKNFGKWYERIDQSPDIVIDKISYQVLRSRSLFNAQTVKNIVVMNDGNFVQDPTMTEKVLEVYTYFDYFNAFEKDIIEDSKRDGEKQFNFLISALEDIIGNLIQTIDEAEHEKLKELLTYYHDAKWLVDEISLAATKGLQQIKKLRELGDDIVLDGPKITQLREIIHNREKMRGQLEALMLNNSLYIRKQVKEILTKESYKTLIKNKENRERIVRDIDYLEYLVHHFIEVGKADWAFDEKWLDIEKGEFTVEKYIDELKNESLGEVFVKTKLAILMKEHWVFA